MEDRCGIRQEIINEGKVLTEEQQRALCMLVTAKDVKRVLMDIPNEKALGNDGYSCFFFKHSWEVVGQDLTAAVLDFFQTGKLLKEINVTSITLIPKVKNASHVSNFSPISCCSVIYKCITKLICDKLKIVLPGLVSQTQGAFVSNRIILHNILLCRDIVRMYKELRDKNRNAAL